MKTNPDISMKIFRESELEDALFHSATGGQALHCHRIITPDAPHCFTAAVKRGEHIGHLFDQDTDRLLTLAECMGLRRIRIHHAGTPKQHVDLCGGPMVKMMVFVHARRQAQAAAPWYQKMLYK